MPFAAIKTDKIDGADRITPSTSDIFINDKLAILNGDAVSSHGSHGSTTIQVIHGTNTFGNGKLMASLADRAACGHNITKGPSNREDVTIET